ncbi:uncharacterized protein LOC126235619 [Schistocerca nitens]|uniref:uncharacterized protein LOC126235619 n=1 Tax=Schistocerca nitens TaxID=7011 RepID=UPI002117A2B2|nr:uncharacterized protein LOC126235619 [Schistocerca nitens]
MAVESLWNLLGNYVHYDSDYYDDCDCSYNSELVVVDALTADLHQALPWTLLDAADVILAAEKKLDLQSQTQNWSDRVIQHSLCLNLKKTKYMIADRHEMRIILITGEDLNRVSKSAEDQEDNFCDVDWEEKEIEDSSEEKCFIGVSEELEALGITNIKEDSYELNEVHMNTVDNFNDKDARILVSELFDLDTCEKNEKELTAGSLYRQKSAIFDPALVCVLGPVGLHNN